MALRDATNSNASPSAGYRISGETYRAAAIKRLKKKQEKGGGAVMSLIPPSKKA